MYPAFAVYSNVDLLSCLNTPYPGFCTMLEARYYAFYSEGEEASSSGRDVKNARRIDAPGR